MGRRGSGQFRLLWHRVYQDTSCLFYVVDSNDRDRVQEAEATLDKMMREDEMRDAVVLVCVHTFTSSTATRSGNFMTDVRKHVKLWWWYAGGTGGDGAVTGGKVQAPGVHGAGRGKGDKGRSRGRGKGKKAGGGDLVPPPAK